VVQYIEKAVRSDVLRTKELVIQLRSHLFILAVQELSP
jgi:hypothetical protein